MSCKGISIEDIKKAFAEFDKDGDHVISLREAHDVLRTRLGYSKERTQRLLRMCDSNRDGQLDFEEFTKFYIKMVGKADELRVIFAEFDSDHDNYITMEEAKIAFRRLALRDEEIEALVRCYDFNDDGRLDYTEFVKLWNAE